MIWVPATQCWELAAAVNHPGKVSDPKTLNQQYGVNVKFVDVTQGLCDRTIRVARERMCLKGADRIMLSCALEKNAILVTIDGPLKANAPRVGVTAMTPTEFLQNPPRPEYRWP